MPKPSPKIMRVILIGLLFAASLSSQKEPSGICSFALYIGAAEALDGFADEISQSRAMTKDQIVAAARQVAKEMREKGTKP